jgi:septal ring factor EnvC (AmiA/AmiB activator)
MRNAEAQVSMNELRQRIADLNHEWQLHDLLAHDVLSLKIREAQLDCDNKVFSRQIMDLETQNQVLHHQIKRQDDEMQRIRSELEQSRIRENELRGQLHDTKNQMHDGELRVN